ncbi:DUF4148 domain-containing protein [Noviherbaspirillum aridicola]|uniref:Uncharacterized protein n=1 Tax=Noviherbaspirillum aridicola TaxID=2849687 RepID=A0ABQ4Q0H9_9BURK|nr:DUF4148 domain-containing protein [Noviherbaspirillum aridicola]GIZ50290.1 hypothetical protein NCCP691_03040 [Noviherbaspirillum aridicola]
MNSEYPQFVVVPSTVTREAVLRELREAQLRGMAVTQRMDGVDTPAPVVSTKTRAEVIAELEAYKRQRPARDLYSGNTSGFGG